VAVLGYSARGANGLHELCAERLRHAEQVVGPDTDAVLLSGRGRRGNVAEAELMRAAWRGDHRRLLADKTAGSTAANAVSIADTARRLDATDVTVVTSRWHAPRARMLVRAALPGVTVRTSSPAGRRPLALLTRELICFVALPYQLMRLRARPRS
jgi:uncharacterized SAM-binding protein YcdF (DUF218 family)